MKIPGIVVSGATSGVGKTTITMAIIHGLQRKGYSVQPFKIGPDYIDPSYHNAISKKRSKNLDVWLMGRKGIIESFLDSTRDSDFAVLEGVMGLFDGLSGRNNFASTAHVSRILDIPIVLVVDARKAARSLAAIALGFMGFDRQIKISGIIINHIASERHLKYITEAFQNKVKVPIIGKIFSNRENKLQERHLGLIPTIEMDLGKTADLMQNSKKISHDIDMEKVIEIGKSKVRAGKGGSDRKVNLSNLESNRKETKERVNISIALDKSFNFYYKDNLELLQKKAKIEFFSPIDNDGISRNSSGIIIGGGFPEIIADRLEKTRQ